MKLVANGSSAHLYRITKLMDSFTIFSISHCPCLNESQTWAVNESWKEIKSCFSTDGGLKSINKLIRCLDRVYAFCVSIL